MTVRDIIPPLTEPSDDRTTRQRFVETAALLFLRRGYAGTGLKQVTVEAGAPVGSLYHHFPGGKAELAEAALRWSADSYAHMVAANFEPGRSLAANVRAGFAGAATTLADSGYSDACPIAAISLEVASASPHLRQVCAEIFEGWTTGLAAAFTAAGLADDDARSLAVVYLTSLEGAFVLARSLRSTEPLLTAGEAVADRVDAVIAARV